MVSPHNGTRIVVGNPPAGGGAAPVPPAAPVPRRRAGWKIITALLGVVGLGALLTQCREEKAPEPPPWRYVWNMATYHNGMGPIVDTHPPFGMEMRLQQRKNCDPSCYSLILIYNENAAKYDFSMPREGKAEEVFDAFLKKGEPYMVYGHVPYRYEGDLVRFEIPAYFDYPQAQQIGYRPFAEGVTEEFKKITEAFITDNLERIRVLNCYYATGQEEIVDYRAFWYQDTPTDADLNVLPVGHPFRQIHGTRDKCPSRVPHR